MENGKLIKIFLVLFLFSNPFATYSYSDTTTHPALTDEIVDFYNHFYSKDKISDSEKESIKKGSIDEDSPKHRVTAHFYDPVRKKGLFGQFLSSKEWALNPLNQGGGITSDLFSKQGDYSWERAIFDYVHENKKRGLEGLGHILHLVEDATVPDHVRDDQHLSGFDYSSHERWTAKYSDKNINTFESLLKERKEPILYQNIGEYFDRVASFTNSNFFSKDTIFDSKYSSPEIEKRRLENSDGVQTVFGVKTLEGKEYRLVKIEENFNFKKGKEIIYSLEDNKDSIVEDYWQILSRQAVMNGAGVIKLFFDEVEKERVSGALLAKNTNWVKEKAKQIAAGIKSGLGIETKAVAEPIEPSSVKPSNDEASDKVPDTKPASALGLLTDEELNRLIKLYMPTASSTESLVKVVRRYMGSVDEEPGLIEESVGTSTLTVWMEGCDTELTPDGCLSTTGSIRLFWDYEGSPATFRITGKDTDVTTSQTETGLSLAHNANHVLDVKAIGASGETLATATVSVAVFPKPVVINEVAWGGTDHAPNDEWIELYNPTPYSIRLDGFSLSGFTSGEIPLSGSLQSKRYYLLERGGDEVVSDRVADLVYDGALSLSDDAGSLALLREGIAVDSTPVEGWPSGTNFDGDRGSMERYAYAESGSDAASWSTNILVVHNGLDREGNPIRGTPGKRNAANYLVMKDGQALPAGLVLDRSPYLVLNPLVVDAGTTFMIDAGVIVKMYGEDTGMTVLGTLVVQGTAELPVVLTSFSDPARGEEIGASAFVDPKYTWGGVDILAGSADSVMSNAIVAGMEDGIFVDQSELLIEDSVLEDNAVGIVANGSDITIEDTEISDTANPITAYGASTVSISGSDIEAGHGSSQALAAYGASTVVVASSSIVSPYGDTIVAFGNASVSLASSTVSAGGNGTGITAFNETSVSVSGSAIAGGETGSAVVAFSASDMSIASSTLIGGQNAAAISVFAESTLEVATSTVLVGENGTGLEVFNDSYALIRDTVITGEGNGTGVHVFQAPGGESAVVIEGSSVSGFEAGVAAFQDAEVVLDDTSVTDNVTPVMDTGGEVVVE